MSTSVSGSPSPIPANAGVTEARIDDERDRWHDVVEAFIPLINVVAIFCGLLIISDLDFGARPACAAILFLFGAGSGLVQVVARFNTAVRWALMVGLSVACSILTAQFLLSVGSLNSTSAAAILTVITATGFFARLVAHIRPSSSGGRP